MLTLTEILGDAAEPAMAERLHHIAHHGAIEYLCVPPRDVGRRRLRLTGDRGTDCAVALARDARLADGAVLLLEHDRAIVVRLGPRHWLRLRPADTAAALELGHAAGHLHWQVKFDGSDLLVAQDGPIELYTARLDALVARRRVALISDD